MVLHLIKLAVGVDDLAHMKMVQAARRKQRRQSPRSPHWVYTRNTPRRAEELLQGGSLYWVVRGVIRCRQELVGFERGFRQGRGPEILPDQGPADPDADRAAGLQGLPGLALLSTPTTRRPTCRRATPATCRRKWQPN